MFVINDKEYELKYTLKKVETIESVLGEPLMAVLVKNNGMMSISTLKTYIAYGLKDVENGTHLSSQHGMQCAEKIFESHGYAEVSAEVIGALERDCPFLFQAD